MENALGSASCYRDPRQCLATMIPMIGCRAQRMVKKIVNFDDPGTYYSYFGDKVGTPESILNFFPWKGNRQDASEVWIRTENINL